MKQAVKDYLSYSRKEMIGVLSFVLLLTLMAIVPALIPERKNAFAEIDLSTDLDCLLATNNDQNKEVQNKEPFEEDNQAKSSPEESSKKSATSFFFFDPNNISDQEWKQLGIKDKAVATINKYKAHGGIFKKPEDILKLYGVPDEVKKALLPYVKIRSDDLYARPKNIEKASDRRVYNPEPDFTRREILKIDINKADSIEWESLPGIGAKLAARIIKFRDRLGGFVTTSQISEVYGIQDSTFQKLKSRLTGGGEVKKLNVNIEDEKVLAQHPYIQFKLARLLVQYRKEHGSFRSIDDLEALTFLQQNEIDKLKPYLTIE